MITKELKYYQSEGTFIYSIRHITNIIILKFILIKNIFSYTQRFSSCRQTVCMLAPYRAHTFCNSGFQNVRAEHTPGDPSTMAVKGLTRLKFNFGELLGNLVGCSETITFNTTRLISRIYALTKYNIFSPCLPE